jgi:hypothetical protein
MVRGDSQLPVGRPETLYTLVTGMAESISTRGLVWLLGSSLLFGVGLLAVSVDYWPLSAIAGTLGTIALWGLIAHRVEHHPSVVLWAVQRFLAVVGTVLAVGAGLALFLGILGPRWNL